MYMNLQAAESNSNYKTKLECWMIEKFEQRGGINGLKITDKNGNSFSMLIGGNTDLYWVPDDYGKVRNFFIEKSDKFLFDRLTKLLADIKKVDNGIYPSLIENSFTFVSEEFVEEESNKLQIIKEDEQFVIKFIKNENISPFSFASFVKGCPICFCNSGSRVPEIEILFMKMFNEFVYQNEDILNVVKRVKRNVDGRELK